MPEPLHPFTERLAKLVWLLVYRPTQVTEHKATLRDALLVSGAAVVTVSRTDLVEYLSVAQRDGSDRGSLSAVSELANRMASHSVKVITLTGRPAALEVLAVARALAAEGVRDDDGQAFDAMLLDLQSTSLSVELGRSGFVRTPTPPIAMPAISPEMLSASAVSALDVSRERLAPKAGPRSPQEQRQQMIVDALQRPARARALDDLLIRLRGGPPPEESPLLMNEIGRRAEDLARDGAWMGVLEVITELMNPAYEEDRDLARAIGVQLRRLAQPTAVRGLAELLGQRRDARPAIHAYFRYVGAPAADVLLDLLVKAERAKDRRAFRDAIVELPSAAKPLQHLLQDHRWFVVRNAAELLGEMGVKEADGALVDVLEHRDVRVRRAATLALIRLGTPRAFRTIIDALRDADSTVRLQAARGLAESPTPRATSALLSALNDEEMEEVQHALMLALARDGSANALARLIDETKAGSLLSRRPLNRRLGAMTALAETQHHDALTTLRALSRERDREIREHAERLLTSDSVSTSVDR